MNHWGLLATQSTTWCALGWWEPLCSKTRWMLPREWSLMFNSGLHTGMHAHLAYSKVRARQHQGLLSIPPTSLHVLPPRSLLRSENLPAILMGGGHRLLWLIRALVAQACSPSCWGGWERGFARWRPAWATFWDPVSKSQTTTIATRRACDSSVAGLLCMCKAWRSILSTGKEITIFKNCGFQGSPE